MKRNTDYTSDIVKDSIQKTITAIETYFNKNWKPGKEYEVTKHIQAVLDKEIDKYLTHSAASGVYFRLDGYAREKAKYDKYYAKYIEKYGPYIMELLVEYANSLSLSGRYDVGDRYNQVRDEILEKMQENLFTKDDIETIVDSQSKDIEKFLKQHGVEEYSLTMGSVTLAINVVGDIILEKKDAPRGTFRHEFNKISGSFICDGCGLTSLQFGPKEVGGDFDCSNNKIQNLICAPKVVGGDFICTGNEKQFTFTEIKREIKVGGKIITDAPMTPKEKEEFRQQLIKEQNEFLKEYRAKGMALDKAIKKEDIRTIEECREYYYNAIDFFKERPWITDQGMKLSYQILMKIYVHLHKLLPEKYPNILNESGKLTKLTNRLKYPDGYDW